MRERPSYKGRQPDAVTDPEGQASGDFDGTGATAPRKFRICFDDLIPQALPSGDADLALTLTPSLETGFYQQTLFRQDFICFTGPQHPRSSRTIRLRDTSASSRAPGSNCWRSF